MVSKLIGITVPVVVVLVVIVLVANVTVVTVGVGEVAVLVDPFASTSEQKIKLGPTGPVWALGGKAPWVDVIDVNVATQSVLMAPAEAAGTRGITEPPILVLSKDGLKIEVDLNIRYNILPSKVAELYVRYPKRDYSTQVIQVVREAVRNVVVQFTAIEVIEKRGALDDPIRKTIEDKIRADPSFAGAINLISLEVLRILPPADFLDAINAKLRAEQDVIKASFTRNESIIKADAQRQAAILQARGLAEAKLIEANATRAAIREVVKSLGCKGAECEEKASQLYLTLLMYKEIAGTGKNILFIVGTTSSGQFILIPSEKSSP